LVLIAVRFRTIGSRALPGWVRVAAALGMGQRQEKHQEYGGIQGAYGKTCQFHSAMFFECGFEIGK
jgi:hypothetical protein